MCLLPTDGGSGPGNQAGVIGKGRVHLYYYLVVVDIYGAMVSLFCGWCVGGWCGFLDRRASPPLTGPSERGKCTHIYIYIYTYDTQYI